MRQCGLTDTQREGERRSAFSEGHVGFSTEAGQGDEQQSTGLSYVKNQNLAGEINVSTASNFSIVMLCYIRFTDLAPAPRYFVRAYFNKELQWTSSMQWMLSVPPLCCIVYGKKKHFLVLAVFTLMGKTDAPPTTYPTYLATYYLLCIPRTANVYF